MSSHLEQLAQNMRTLNGRFKLWTNSQGRQLFRDTHGKVWIYNPARYHIHAHLY